MRLLYNGLSFLALVNLLALLMVAVWLWQSGRLDMSRVHEARALFSRTIQEAESAAQADATARAVDESQRAAAERRANPPLHTSEQVRQIRLNREQEMLAMRRLDDQRHLLLTELDGARHSLQEQEASLEANRADWKQSVGVQRDEVAEAQFAKVVRQLESIPAKQAKQILLELVNTNRRVQAVAYLDAMQSRSAAKVLREFRNETEARLAADLLEELRTFGLPADAQGASSDADSTSSNS